MQMVEMNALSKFGHISESRIASNFLLIRLKVKTDAMNLILLNHITALFSVTYIIYLAQ